MDHNSTRPSAWPDSEPIDALQRAAYALVVATESIKKQFQPPATTPGTMMDSGAAPLLSTRDASTDTEREMGSGPPGRLHVQYGSETPPSFPSGHRTSNPSDRTLVGFRTSRPLQPSTVSQSAVLLPDILPSRYGTPFAAPSDSLEARLVLAQPSGSSCTLVPSPDVKAGMDVQCPPQSYKGSPLRKEYGDGSSRSRTVYRHSSYEPGRRKGFRRKVTLDHTGSVPLLKSGRHQSRHSIDEEDVHLMGPESGPGQSTPGPPPVAPTSSQPDGFSFSQEVWFVLVICLAQMLMLSGLAQAMAPAQIMGQSFPDSSPGTMAWYSAAYGLTSATFVLPSGRLGDLFGHRIVFLVGCGWFALWSLAAGFAPNVQHAGFNGNIYFCFCRAMQVSPVIDTSPPSV